MSPGTRTSLMGAGRWGSRAGAFPVSQFERAHRKWIVCHLKRREEEIAANDNTGTSFSSLFLNACQ